ncbi:MAG: 1,4-alpha-glucan branching enzyme [Deltaproteobacteria bacterium GWC2_65_14]|nr:MAG: 1,4-alpha-glucan branching enzyme [Deltaproteobacteria bacterium GWC2_65_14]
MRYDVTLLTDQDLYLFNEGSHYRLYEKFGSHFMTAGGEEGTLFTVWAPNASEVFVTGSFNGWNNSSHPLRSKGGSGIWEGFIPGVPRGTVYKYHVVSRENGYRYDKADPFAFHAEVAPSTGSVVWDLWYDWEDAAWMKERGRRNAADAPVTIYEMHLGSWMRVPEEGNRMLTYRELAPRLADYLRKLNFTHVEFLPVMEHPFYGSWGYQVTGVFAPTSRYGTPQDFMYLVDHLHRNGIGVILDWVPSHFTKDGHGLNYFDGTHLYEHADPRQGHHPDWDTEIFNYGRHEVCSFLLSSAHYWLEVFHADGLRVDAVASMLYLDYSRKEGEWIPNRYGGRENIEAIEFLRRFNVAVYESHPDILTVAEESTAWPMVSRPTYLGGLGFGMKWDMGWMHDTLQYMSQDPVHRKYHHDKLTFRMIYSFAENFVLPLSHDEVVHGKGSLIGKMPGDEWQQFANLRALYGYMYAQPGKKLLFMGGEFGQRREWSHEGSLEWDVLEYPVHAGLSRWVEELNRFYRNEPALHERDFDPAGFEWVDCQDADQSVISLLRKGRTTDDILLGVFNFTPVPRHNYRLGVPRGGFWQEVLNSDAREYGGSGQGNIGGVEAVPIPVHGRLHSLTVVVPPLAAVFFKSEGKGR